MHLLRELNPNSEYEGKLAVLEQKENSPIFVVWETNEQDQTVMLVELDRPVDGKRLVITIAEQTIYILEPLEVVERVTEWK